MINEKRQRSDSALRIASPIAKCSLSSLSLLIADINGDPHLSGSCQNKCQARSSVNYGLDLGAFLGGAIDATRASWRWGFTICSTEW